MMGKCQSGKTTCVRVEYDILIVKATAASSYEFGMLKISNPNTNLFVASIFDLYFYPCAKEIK